MKIYLAGPDIFMPDALAWAEQARQLCRTYGYESLTPLDHTETVAEKIFQANIALIRKAQIVVANLDPFRGAEPDSGTAFELGYALALGKRICGYVTRLISVADRVELAEGRVPVRYGDRLSDSQGRTIEDFGMPCNLMLAVPAMIIQGGLEDCLKAMRNRPNELTV